MSSLECDYGDMCHSECKLRHLDEYEKLVHDKSETTYLRSLIICAGPERSGSTWLYNAVRHLFVAARVPCDSYWIHRLTKEKLNERVKQGRVVLIKTHKYYSDYDEWLFQSFRPFVLLTHRDLRKVLASYIRVGWTSDIPDSYVEHHMQWLQHVTLDLSLKMTL